MKQIEKYSIGGYAFTLEKEASQAVAAYLKEMAVHYPNPEIVEGIEERMAELLLEKTPADGVVTLATVQQIMGILGRPETIEEEEPERTTPEEKPRKKLYRDLENARVAGVCSGLASYLNIDPAVLRLAFLIFTILGFVGGLHVYTPAVSISFPVLYVVFWICMPAARTARQRWEQRGEDGTAESLRRNIESGAAEVGDALRQVGKSPAWGRLGRVLEIFFGLLLLIVAVSGLFACGLGLFGWEWLGLRDAYDSIVREAIYDYPRIEAVINTPWVQGLAATVCFLPFLGMLYGSIMMIFHFKSPSWHPGLVIFVLWLIAIVALAILVCSVILSADIQDSYYAFNFLSL
jgi:phage shock protein PspC (stress-responsive transcriptional regulator)